MMINLSSRELFLLRIFIGMIIISVVYFLIITPVINFKNNTERRYQENIQKLSELDSIYADYNEIKHRINRYDRMLKRTGGITSLVERNAEKRNIAHKIAHTRESDGPTHDKYKIISTEVKFEGVDITLVLQFVHDMENSDRLLKINYLRIHESLRGGDIYDVTMRIDTMSAR